MPRELLFGLIVVILSIFTVMKDSKKTDHQNRKRHYRSFKSPVASNAELFEAFHNETLDDEERKQ